MSPIQQMLLGAGAVADKTYVDDIFSSYLWTGNSSSRSIDNGVDLSTEGGMVWIKRRNSGGNHQILDTARGATKALYSNDSSVEETFTNGLTAFNSNGFSLNNHGNYNTSSNPYVSWTFRKSPGFFDVVTYTGNGSNRTISHDLGCVPGCYMIKRTDTATDWKVFHRSLKGKEWYLELNTTDQQYDMGGLAPTAPTASEFSVGTDSSGWVNANGGTYVCYLFAGGESTAATARSVDGFDGNTSGSWDSLSISNSSDYQFGSGDFTVECWYKMNNSTDSDRRALVSNYNYANTRRSWVLEVRSDGKLVFTASSNGGNSFPINVTTDAKISRGTWNHIAAVRNGSNFKLFLNGTVVKSVSVSGSFYDNTNDPIYIGSANNLGNAAHGAISNVRITKGQAVYTSSFKPSSEPLTTTTGGATASNVKLLCCNNSSITGSTVVSGTISSTGSLTASSDSPFDDPAGFSFGDAGDQNVIKCGSYVGTGSAGLEVNVGWEPSWVLIKNSSTAKEWKMLDSMRGLPTGSGDNVLIANSNEAETGSLDNVDLTSTGFKLTSNNSHYNTDGDTYIYMCIRRSDGYVGKPPELGTGVFAMDTGNSSSTVPCFDSGFPVDFLLQREFASQDSWITGSRHTGNTYMYTNASDAEAGGGGQGWDSNVGGGTSRGSSYQAWMWKRHAGFTVCAWEGDGVIGRQIAHDMNKIPEMIWLKKRTGTARNWPVYHKGLDGGSSPEEKVVWLNLTNAESDSLESWNNTAPTSTHFTIHGTANEPNTNTDGEDYIAMLFASVDGISKVGSYDGDSSNNISLTLGFTPRLLIIKSTTDTTGWVVMDSLRDSYAKQLQLNSSAAQNTDSNHLIVSMNSTTTVLEPNKPDTSASNEKYIYYAHA